MSASSVDEADLHAYVDGRLEPARCVAVEAYLAANPAERQRLADYRAIDAELRRLFDPVLSEAVPASLKLPLARRWVPPVWLARTAVAAGFMLFGGAIGWFAHEWIGQPFVAGRSCGRLAAHVRPRARGSPSGGGGRRPAATSGGLVVEVLRARRFERRCWNRWAFNCWAGGCYPPRAAQFMYQNTDGRRLTRTRQGLDGNRDTAFRFAEQDGVGAFYWVDGELAYALIGDLDRPLLDRVAHAVYQQLNP